MEEASAGGVRWWRLELAVASAGGDRWWRRLELVV